MHLQLFCEWRKNSNYKSNKINRATQNIFLLINRLKKEKNSATSIDGCIGACARTEDNFRSVFVYWAVAPATNTVKVMSSLMKLKLGSGCCVVGCVSHTFIFGDPPQYQNFSKSLC